MKKDIVGFTFACLVLAFTASAGHAWQGQGQGWGGHGYRHHDGGVTGAVKHLVREVAESVGLRSNHHWRGHNGYRGAYNGGYGGGFNGGFNGGYRQPYVIQQPVIVPVRQFVPVYQNRGRGGHRW